MIAFVVPFSLALLAPLACGEPPAAKPPATEPQEAYAPPEEEDDYLRFVDEGGGRARLESSVVRFADAKGRTVDLVAAVHVADAEYYDLLNRLFRGYDAVLYELVAPKDTKPKPGRDSGLGAFQRFLSDGLGLEFQLDGIDYQPENFVHADLTPREFERLMADRGDSLFLMMFRASFAEAQRAVASGDTTQQESSVALLAAVFAKDRASALKYALGRQFDQMERIVAGFEAGSGEEGSVLVAERNRAAVRALANRLDLGDDKLAIFYGGAHMPDLAKRLAELGFERAGEPTWLVAWDVRPSD